MKNLNWDSMGTVGCLAVVAGMGWGDCRAGCASDSSAAQTSAGASRESAVEESTGRGVLSRAALDYHQFNGVWAAEDCEGGLTRYTPEGTGDHALQFALAQSPQTTVLWEVGPGGEVFETDQGLFVDRSSSGGILFGEEAYEALESAEREPPSARVSTREPGGTSD
ncbi:MAG: hypothetical protein QF903_16040 [Planctomycetota bacterium]|nr:hypothetical protein [Planctomycetota bacterium]MDP6990981.1 hypothetical protein [Planctomycetota bacterium]